MEILTDFVKKRSISGDLDTEADKTSNQFGTDEFSRQLDDEAVVKGRWNVAWTQSEGDLNLTYKRTGSWGKKLGKGRRSTLHIGWNINHPS